MKLMALFGASALLVCTRPAGACGALPPHYALLGQPAASQTDVPTDVVPVYDTTELGGFSISEVDQTSFELHTSTGELVPISLERAGTWHVALRPSAPLQPNTSYVVEARHAGYLDGPPLFDLTLTFTTGTGPLPADPLPAPASASLQYWWSENGDNSAACDFWGRGACVAVPAGDFVQVRYLSSTGEASDPLLHDGPFESDMPRDRLSGEGMCIEVRRRAVNGVLGEATVTCEAARPEARLPGAAQPSCTEAGVAALDWDARDQPFTIDVADLIPPSSPLPPPAGPQASTTGARLDSEAGGDASGCNMAQPSASSVICDNWHGSGHDDHGDAGARTFCLGRCLC